MRLEQRIGALQVSRMYGLLYPGEPTAYYACLRLNDEHSMTQVPIARSTGRALRAQVGPRLGEQDF